MSNPNDHLSDRELLAMTRQLDEMHRDDALPKMKAAVAEWVESFHEATDGVSKKASSRRTFLLGTAGVGASGLILAACGSSSKKAASTPTTTGGSSTSTGAANSSAALTGDLAVAATAASLENLGVYAYKAGISAATAGKLGTVPPAVVTFAKTAMQQHMDHAEAWNSALTGAGKPAVTATDPALTPTVNTAFSKVTNVAQLGQLALLVENIAAQTYQAAIPALTAKSSIGVAATIQPVEMQHAAILYYVLGEYPGIQGTQSNMYASGPPLAFNPTTLARPATDYTAA
ncbi:MAG TPA: ferritin-like domain-containing protein [Acidimicrobiales bacterium]|nr:ferritin-like domain-containing protein [Acidimicrobiales bacterium]